MAQLNIFFDNISKFYFEGEKIRIKLEVNLDKSSTINNILANFVGVSTFKTPNEKQSNTLLKFSTKDPTEIYFDDVLPLFVAQNVETASWSPGIQVFMFDFQLPTLLPSSLESPHGFVRYSINVIAEENEKVQKKTEHFTVVSRTDLSKHPSINLPGVVWKPETHCLLEQFICKSGSVRAFLHLPKRGYVPGEYLIINAELSNIHRFPVEWVKVSLIQVLKFSGSKLVKQTRTVTEMARGCILPFETQTWRSEEMIIPPIPPTTSPPKRLLNVKYKLILQFKPSWKTKPTELKIKLLIGTVGAMDCAQEEEHGQGEGEKVYISKYFNESNLEPCVFGPHTLEEDGKSSTFSPLYPIHNPVQY